MLIVFWGEGLGGGQIAGLGMFSYLLTYLKRWEIPWPEILPEPPCCQRGGRRKEHWSQAVGSAEPASGLWSTSCKQAFLL